MQFIIKDVLFSSGKDIFNCYQISAENNAISFQNRVLFQSNQAGFKSIKFI